MIRCHQGLRDREAGKGVFPLAGWGDADSLSQGLVRAGFEEDLVVEEETAGDSLVSGPSREFGFGVLSELSSCVARGSVAKTPYFLETISCLAGIIGESWDSGLGLGLDAGANLGTSSSFQEGSRGQHRGRGARFENRADNRRFRVRANLRQ
jgi:hypothetical protein